MHLRQSNSICSASRPASWVGLPAPQSSRFLLSDLNNRTYRTTPSFRRFRRLWLSVHRLFDWENFHPYGGGLWRREAVLEPSRTFQMPWSGPIGGTSEERVSLGRTTPEESRPGRGLGIGTSTGRIPGGSKGRFSWESGRRARRKEANFLPFRG